jgi:hypothetical protein
MGAITNPSPSQYSTFNDVISDFKQVINKRDFLREYNNDDICIIARKFVQHLPSIIQNKSRRSSLKKIGESYVCNCIELWLWQKGYSLNGLSGNSFTIDEQVSGGGHRIDFILEIDGNSFITCIIDAKNWARYNKKDAIRYAKKHIISFNSFTGNYKLIFLNEKNIPHVKKLLSQNNIIPIPIRHHITDRRFIKTFFILDLCMKETIQYLDKAVPILNVSKNIINMSNNDAMKYDIELGKPYKLIKKKWWIKQAYIDKLKAELKKSGVKLPDRNKHPFTRLNTYHKFL